MSDYLEAAMKKLAGECKGAIGKKEDVMKGAVKAQLEEFCRQDGEFAQAVAQGGSFQDCMKAVAQGVGNCISDLEAYSRAVKFYFPGAEVKMQLRVDLIGQPDNIVPLGQNQWTEPSAEEGKAQGKTKIFDLTDFL